ncbi:MAG: aminotransferase class I/II-fold pyridoxal phosphate-dependent enzyme [Bacilli bacterium]|nr:aminotransferase class I/II-fold pyridoxal phosphate-dependent enzyme [Bacilli bacterium]
MSTRYLYKNNYFVLSDRNFEDDYSNTISLSIDMTMSGKYLARYPKFKLNTKKFCDYPSHKEITKLELKIKEKYNIKNSVIIGSGSNGILQNLIKILFKDGGNLVTPFLTFNQAEYATSALNCKTKRVYMSDNNINLDKIFKSVDKETKMVYICNPNNPSGLIIDNKKLIKLSKELNCAVVVDESSIEFSNYSSLIEEDNIPDNLYIIKTFSKAYGIANLRVGYLICNKNFEKIYKQNITVNEVSGVSCIIAEQVLNSNRYKKNIKKIKSEIKYLVEQLKNLNIECYPTNSNILLTKSSFEQEILEQLYKNSISVVPIYDEKNNLLIRIAIQNHATNRKFIKKISSIIEENPNLILNKERGKSENIKSNNK